MAGGRGGMGGGKAGAGGRPASLAGRDAAPPQVIASVEVGEVVPPQGERSSERLELAALPRKAAAARGAPDRGRPGELGPSLDGTGRAKGPDTAISRRAVDVSGSDCAAVLVTGASQCTRRGERPGKPAPVVLLGHGITRCDCLLATR